MRRDFLQAGHRSISFFHGRFSGTVQDVKRSWREGRGADDLEETYGADPIRFMGSPGSVTNFAAAGLIVLASLDSG
jgi:hypothetical protein